LQERRDAWRVARVSVSYYDQQKQLPLIKLEREDVEEVYAQVLQETLRRVDKGFQAFFRRLKAGRKAGYPRFKSVRRYNSFIYPQNGSRLEGDKLTLSKIGSARVHLSRPVEGRVKTCTIKREVDGRFVIFTVEEYQCRYFPKTGANVGVDVGLESFATLSTGEAIPNPEYLRQSERVLTTPHSGASHAAGAAATAVAKPSPCSLRSIRRCSGGGETSSTSCLYVWCVGSIL
jgi:putative transposase